MDDINLEIESERRDTVALSHLEREVADKRRALIEKRENLARLERKSVLLLAVKAVEELPQGTRVQRYSRFYELVGVNGIDIDSVHPRQLSLVLGGTADEAYTTVFLIA